MECDIWLEKCVTKSKKPTIKVNKTTAMFTGRNPRYTKATTAGHPEGIKPKPGVDIRAAKGEEGHALCETIKTKTDSYGNKRNKDYRVEKRVKNARRDGGNAYR
jgi:hypothetical protein